MIQLHDKQFVPFISAQEIDFAIAKMVSLKLTLLMKHQYLWGF
jgi:hypothetical protein